MWSKRCITHWKWQLCFTDLQTMIRYLNKNKACFNKNYLFFFFLNLLSYSILISAPFRSIIYIVQNRLLRRHLGPQFLSHCFWRNQNFIVLLDQFREILKEGVLRPEKIKLVIFSFFLHQLRQKASTISCNELCYRIKYEYLLLEMVLLPKNKIAEQLQK